MAENGDISRRQFVGAAISVTAVSSLPAGSILAKVGASGKPVQQTPVPLTESPGWKDQGVENLAKSPHAKLRDIRVRAVTITGGFWGRREINVTRSIPTMHDLLEANGRMNNFRRLVG